MASSGKGRTPVKMAKALTLQQGDTFADMLVNGAFASGIVFNACRAAGVLTWPDDPDAQWRHNRIVDEICGRALDAVKHDIARAFVTVAAEVVARERSDED